MKRKEYVERAKLSILNRVKFHAPITYDNKVDKKILASFGVDVNLPVFKFDKVLTKELLKAFSLAKEEQDFNLLLSTECFLKNKKQDLRNMKNVVLFDKLAIPASFMEAINKLNINYPSSSNYNLMFKDKFFKLNGQILNPSYQDFSLKKVTLMNELFVDYQEFVLNGTNFFVRLQNKSMQGANAEFELNIPLKKGYYFFKRSPKCVMIENLLTKEKAFLNFNCRNAKFSFSDVDGLENSVFACLNVKVKVSLSRQEEYFAFFNFGAERFAVSGLREIKFLQELAKKKCCEIFNLRVLTKNPKFDCFFNRTLPQKIWINWLNGQIDEKLEEKYLTLKRLFIKGSKKMDLINFKEIGLRELGIFNGDYYKKIFIVSGQEKFLRVGKTFFWNINGITDNSLKSNEPMSVCFGG